MLITWTEVEALANSYLVLASVGAISYAGLPLRHEREYRSVANLEKQLSCPYAGHYNNLLHLMRRIDVILLRRMPEKNANQRSLWAPERIVGHYRYEQESGGRLRRTRGIPSRDVARQVTLEVVRKIQQAEPEIVPNRPEANQEASDA